MLQSEEEWREQWKDMINHTKAILIKKWFIMEPEDVSSIVDLQITKAYKRTQTLNKDVFVLTPKTIISFTNRAITKEVAKRPGVEKVFEEDPKTGKKKKKILNHGCSSLDVTSSLEDKESSPMVDMIPGEEPDPFEVLERQEVLEEQKAIVLKHMSKRTFDQLVFEYQHHCVTPAHLNYIHKLKGKIRNELKQD